ncbi:hypothetical protein EVAR_52175_1 [Eumeta japonica]|uniref:Uncharacterized protein n=1 Tax=Eumeta variegata TaxID=151549 RepID=A0A4C1YE26_EUMVA|nr:hypothetical protein EVAR_52175_1 [Eumeta japonica]
MIAVQNIPFCTESSVVTSQFCALHTSKTDSSLKSGRIGRATGTMARSVCERGWEGAITGSAPSHSGSGFSCRPSRAPLTFCLTPSPIGGVFPRTVFCKLVPLMDTRQTM